MDMGIKKAIILEKEIDGKFQTFKSGSKFGWIEWNSDSTFKELHDKPSIERSFILDPQSMSYTWLTSAIKEIISEDEKEIVFQTKNTRYKLLINA
jgi:hypothetical protein